MKVNAKQKNNIQEIETINITQNDTKGATVQNYDEKTYSQMHNDAQGTTQQIQDNLNGAVSQTETDNTETTQQIETDNSETASK
ncbi:hypothetical protein AN642_01235 [Epulopiscium sp. SCG-B10WGA-EpuloA2]|nr:hypothetical protein AN642_01235 [Epulopiscium sp. SCG-B10WGA-EpuloA2]